MLGSKWCNYGVVIWFNQLCIGEVVYIQNMMILDMFIWYNGDMEQ